MTRIVIDNNKIVGYHGTDVVVTGGKIQFFKSGDYTLEYVSSDQVSLEVEVDDEVVVKLFIFSVDNKITVNNHYRLGKKSSLLLFQFYQNIMVREKLVIDLDGDYAKFYMGFSSISKGDEEYYIIVNHNGYYGCSDIVNKCIGVDGSKIHLQIDSVLKKGNRDCVMDQESRILTLGEVEAKIVPNMFIEEDSVIAKHGSVIGGFREEELFYLMSRGIEKEEAIFLLIKGFVFSNLVVDMEKRAMILECLQKLRR